MTHKFFLRLMLIAGFLFPTLTAADLNIDEVRIALEAENFEELENLFQSAHDASRTAQSFDDIRLTYSTLFVVAHTERLEVTKRWLDANPQSPYAALGLAWLHYYRAFEFRGGGHISEVTQTGQMLFGAEIVLANANANLAYSLAPEFGPSIDAQILLTPYNGRSAEVPSLIAQGLAIETQIHWLFKGISALNLAWGGTWEQNDGLCRQFGHRFPGSDYDICMMMVVFQNDIQGEWRQYALATLDAADDPAFDGYRLSAYLNEWSHRPQAQAEAIRIHRASLGPTMNIRGYTWGLNLINRHWPENDYWQEAGQALNDMVLSRLHDNAHSLSLLRAAISIYDSGDRWDHSSDPAAQAAFGYWLRMMEMGRHRADTWELGEILIGRTEDASTSIAYHHALTNRIYYSDFDLGEFYNYYDRLMMAFNSQYVSQRGVFAPPQDATRLNEMLLCPALRARRVYNYICSGFFQPGGCQDDLNFGDDRGLVAALTSEEGRCPTIQETSGADLIYTPIPVETFRDLLLNAD